MGLGIGCSRLLGICGLAALSFFECAGAQTTAPNEWTWMGGSSTLPCASQCGQPGIYGTLGVVAPQNAPGGRQGASSWVDKSGYFWLFGGNGFTSGGPLAYSNDLWQFNPSANQWTWVGGSETAPSYYGQGPAGVYGTQSQPADGNIPGGRAYSASWVDSSGNFWLFGGQGFDVNGAPGCLNDLWEFNPSTGKWTWIAGNNTTSTSISVCGHAGVYGTVGVPAIQNTPGGRSKAASWTDKDGHLWLFGGLGLDSQGNPGLLNDLWEFDPLTSEWKWIGGSNTVPVTNDASGGSTGVYGTRGTPVSSNFPGGREGSSSWTDLTGNFWLFGGSGIDGGGNGGLLNDLWEFNPTTAEWTWVCGSTLNSDFGTSLEPCGDMGNSATGFVPSARWLTSSWTDSKGRLWLSAGAGQVQLNELWVFDPSSMEWQWENGQGPNSTTYSGVYGTLAVAALSNIPGERNSASAWIDAHDSLWLFGGEGYDAESLYSNSSNYGYLNDLWQYSLTGVPVSGTSIPTFGIPSGTYTAAQMVSIVDATAEAAIYYTTDGSTPTTSSTVYSAAITVSSTETIKAIAIASGSVASAIASATYTITPPAATPMFSIPGGTYTSAQGVTIADSTAGATIYFTTDGSTPTNSSTAYTGMITVSKSETIQAIAVASGYSTSSVASATYTINLPPPGFTFAVAPGGLTMKAGAAGTTTLTVTPQNGFNSAVSFACSGLPTGATCTFSPTTVTPSGNAATTTLTITAPSTSAALYRGLKPGLPMMAIALAVSLFGWRRGRRSLLLLGLAVVLGSGFAAACGGGGGSSGGGNGGGGSTPVTSTVTVTATSGSLNQAASITLTVN